VLQGTVLVADDVPEMARALRLPEAVLRERVTCLASGIGRAPPLQAIKESIVTGLREALGRDCRVAAPTAAELDLCERLLRDEIGTDAYVKGRAVAPA
jgi:lipoate-protein ligase A